MMMEISLMVMAAVQLVRLKEDTIALIQLMERILAMRFVVMVLCLDITLAMMEI